MQSRRKFSKEFKEETVKLASQSGVTLKQLGAELGLSPNMISRWRRELVQSGTGAFKGKGHTRDEEMARLKRELARVKKERDFLRDAAVFFAKESK